MEPLPDLYQESSSSLFAKSMDNEELASYLSDDELAGELRELDLVVDDDSGAGDSTIHNIQSSVVVSDDDMESTLPLCNGRKNYVPRNSAETREQQEEGQEEGPVFDANIFSFEAERVPLTPTGVRSTFRAFASDRLFNTSPATPSSTQLFRTHVVDVGLQQRSVQHAATLPPQVSIKNSPTNSSNIAVASTGSYSNTDDAPSLFQLPETNSTSATGSTRSANIMLHDRDSEIFSNANNVPSIFVSSPIPSHTVGSTSLGSFSSTASFITASTDHRDASEDNTGDINYNSEAFGFGDIYLDDIGYGNTHYDDHYDEEDKPEDKAFRELHNDHNDCGSNSVAGGSSSQQLPSLTFTLTKSHGVFSKVTPGSGDLESSSVTPKYCSIVATHMPPRTPSRITSSSSAPKKQNQRQEQQELRNEIQYDEQQQQQQEQQQQQQRRGLVHGGNCGCRKTHCLKLYCECFSSGNTCQSSCGCTDCWNQPSDKGSERRRAAVARCLIHKSRTFRPKLHIFRAEGMAVDDKRLLAEEQALQNGGLDAAKGGFSGPRCFCKKSKCIKKYCDCFSAGVKCDASRCKCENCANREPQQQEQSQEHPQEQQQSYEELHKRQNNPKEFFLPTETGSRNSTTDLVMISTPHNVDASMPPVVHTVVASPQSPFPSKAAKSTSKFNQSTHGTPASLSLLPISSSAFASAQPQVDDEGVHKDATNLRPKPPTTLKAIVRSKRSGPSLPAGGPTAPTMPRANKKPLPFDLRLRGRRGSRSGVVLLQEDQRVERN